MNLGQCAANCRVARPNEAIVRGDVAPLTVPPAGARGLDERCLSGFFRPREEAVGFAESVFGRSSTIAHLGF